MVLIEGDRECVVAQPSREGKPSHPAISGDGRRMAVVRTDPQGRTCVEVTDVATGPLGWLQRLGSSVTTTTLSEIVAVDLSDDGRELGFLTSDGALHVSPTRSDRNGRSVWMGLPAVEGSRSRGRDLSLLSDGRLAVQTESGAWLITDGTTTMRARLADVDPENHARVTRDWGARLPQADAARIEHLVDRFGACATDLSVAPNGSAALVQMPSGDGRVRNVLIELESGREADLGISHPMPAVWRDEGREVVVADGVSARLSRVFPGWDRDLGQADLARRRDEVGTVHHEEAFLVVNGVRIPRRA